MSIEKKTRYKMKLQICFAWLLLSSFAYIHAKIQGVEIDYSTCADMVIFSYHRPAQLYALCESLKKYIVRGCGTVSVIYRADTDEYRAGYALVQKDFSDIVFLSQSDNPHADFKPLTLQATFESPCDYVVFAVDDIIIKDFIDLTECIQALQKTGAYGFYLRLGVNLSQCYMLSCSQGLPRFQRVSPRVLAWQLSIGQHDWGYPNTVDMTVYRKSDIRTPLTTLSYYGPNLLEGYWAQQGTGNQYAMGLCYIHSKIVNIPCNRVQDVFAGNRFMHALSPQELLQLFVSGKKIAIDDFARIANPAAHAEYDFRFIDR